MAKANARARTSRGRTEERAKALEDQKGDPARLWMGTDPGDHSAQLARVLLVPLVQGWLDKQCLAFQLLEEKVHEARRVREVTRAKAKHSMARAGDAGRVDSP